MLHKINPLLKFKIDFSLRIKFLLIIFISFLCNSIYSQGVNFTWAKTIGGTSYDYNAYSVIDALGNVYTTGYYSNIVDFDPGPGVFNLTANGNSYDIFVCKIDAAGNFVWAKSLGTPNNESGQSIIVDGVGNVYVAGWYDSTLDFDPGPGTFNLTSSGGFDIFVLKLDVSGNFVWAQSMGGPSVDMVNSINVDGSGNVYTAGYFLGTSDFDPGPGVYTITAAGLNDAFISKLDASGNFVWAKNLGGNAAKGNALSISIDNAGNAYSAGAFNSTIDFDPGPGVYTLTPLGNRGAFVSKLDASGNFVWAKSVSGGTNTGACSLALDAAGNVHIAGYFDGTTDLDPGAGVYTLTSAGLSDIFICKLDQSGNLIWAQNMGGINDDIPSSISIDGVGSVLTTGYFSGTADFDPGAGVLNLTSVGLEDIFICKLKYSGALAWAKSMGGTNNDVSVSIATDANQNIYVSGNFLGIADLNPLAAVNNFTSLGYDDIFIEKLKDLDVGIPEQTNGLNSISIYPNPNTGIFSVTSDLTISKIEIVNILGETIYSKDIHEEGKNVRAEIDLSNQTNGIYFYKIFSANNTVLTGKIMVQ